MEILIALISLASSILAIILFFKIWGMCNDVKRIAEAVAPKEETAEPQTRFVLPEDDGSALAIGDVVYCRLDGKPVRIDRSSADMYYCLDPETSAYKATYNRKELTRIPGK